MTTPTKKYPGQRVLTVLASLVDTHLAAAYGNNRDFIAGDWSPGWLELAPFAFYMDRDPAEADPLHKQLITYAVLMVGDEVLIYTRGKSGAEDRLHNKRSIGVGGHIEPCAPLGETVNNSLAELAFRRELAEEVKFDPMSITQDVQVLDVRRLGFLNYNGDPVGQVHLGLVTVYNLSAWPANLVAEHDVLNDMEFVNLASLAPGTAAFEGLEPWSQLTVEQLIPILSGEELHQKLHGSKTFHRCVDLDIDDAQEFDPTLEKEVAAAAQLHRETTEERYEKREEWTP